MDSKKTRMLIEISEIVKKEKSIIDPTIDLYN
jgi:hypothetical protein